MKLQERIVNAFVRFLLKTVCKLDAEELQKLPRSGPVILTSNHTTNIEGPAIYVLIQPRHTTALGKRELWENPFTRLIVSTWDIIPVKRGAVDSGALRACLEVLAGGALLGIAPEGTRSRSGRLTRGHRGAAMLAVRSGVPVYPVAQWGFRDISENLRKLRRTPVTFRVGRPFTVRVPDGTQPTAGQLRQIADEMMYQIAALLPARYRGVYADMEQLTTQFLQFSDPR